MTLTKEAGIVKDIVVNQPDLAAAIEIIRKAA